MKPTPEQKKEPSGKQGIQSQKPDAEQPKDNRKRLRTVLWITAAALVFILIIVAIGTAPTQEDAAPQESIQPQDTAQQGQSGGAGFDATDIIMWVLIVFGVITFSAGYFPRFLKPWLLGGLVAITFFQVMSAFTEVTESIVASQNASSTTVTASGVMMNIPWSIIKIGLIISIPFAIYIIFCGNRGLRI